jgi:hypothetical protein
MGEAASTTLLDLSYNYRSAVQPESLRTLRLKRPLLHLLEVPGQCELLLSPIYNLLSETEDRLQSEREVRGNLKRLRFRA